MRLIAPGDVSWVTEALQSGALAKNTSGIPHPVSESFVKHWIENWIAFEANNTGWRMVRIHQNGQGTGSAAIKILSPTIGELSFWVAPPFWRRGVASTLCQHMISQAKDKGLRTLTAGHFVGNAGSRATLTKQGFVPTHETLEIFSQARNRTVQTRQYRLDLL